MAQNNEQGPMWEFIKSFSNGQGAGVDHQASGYEQFFANSQAETEGHANYSHPPQPPQPPHPPHPAHPHHPPHPHRHDVGQDPSFAPPFGSPWAGPWGAGAFSSVFGVPFDGHRGGRGRRRCNRRGDSHERRDHTPSGSDAEDPPEVAPGERESHAHGPHSHGPHPFGFGHRGRHGRGGRRGGPGRRVPHGQFPGVNGFDLSGLFENLGLHPLAQAFRDYTGQQSGKTTADDENNFTPPIDVFSTPTAYILHVALPGAKKEDVGVNWDAEKGILNIAGVVYRPGDEEFLKTLSQSERKVGAFERAVKLPPGSDDKENVDGDGIHAKLEDGVLVVTVPKVEKEWTEVKRVDIE